MTVLFWLIPIALGMGIVGLLAFLWSMRSGQYEDLDGAAERVLLNLEEDRPITDDSHKSGR
jgi:cbb3-type cytochrome oxidase maturation protein